MLSKTKEFLVTRVLDRMVKVLPRHVRLYLATHGLRIEASEFATPPYVIDRELLANVYLDGDGLEIGALGNPLKVPDRARVIYLDFQQPENLQRFNPTYTLENINRLDLISDGQTLACIKDEALNFVIANHLIEHCEDPIGTLKNFFRVLKTDGILFISVPDKRFTFDVRRPVTEFSHLLRDHLEGPEWSRFDHYKEAHYLIGGVTDEQQIRRHIREMGHTHFHVWTQLEILDLLVRLRKDLAFDFEIEAIVSHARFEVMLVLRKGAGRMSEEEIETCLAREREAYKEMYPDFAGS